MKKLICTALIAVLLVPTYVQAQEHKKSFKETLCNLFTKEEKVTFEESLKAICRLNPTDIATLNNVDELLLAFFVDINQMNKTEAAAAYSSVKVFEASFENIKDHQRDKLAAIKKAIIGRMYEHCFYLNQGESYLSDDVTWEKFKILTGDFVLIERGKYNEIKELLKRCAEGKIKGEN